MITLFPLAASEFVLVSGNSDGAHSIVLNPPWRCLAAALMGLMHQAPAAQDKTKVVWQAPPASLHLVHYHGVFLHISNSV